MSVKDATYRQLLGRYLPEFFIEYVIQLLKENPVRFKIVKPRKTKLGDFRFGDANSKPQITVNGNLNQYSFLVTTIHEFAHLIAFERYGRRINPHGKEWKAVYCELLLPVVNSGELPEELETAIRFSMSNVKASSCTDHQLQRTLMEFDEKNHFHEPLERLEKNSIFALNGRLFEKGELRRTRYLCTELSSRKKYLVSALALVEKRTHGE